MHLWLGRCDTADSTVEFRRSVLARYTGLEPAELRFTTGVHGKPALTDSPTPIEFNVSHSGEWQVCAITRDFPLGVDIEYCEPQRDVLKLARRFFSATEFEALAQQDEATRLQRFYDLWTLKESRVKALGLALAPQLNATAFSFSNPASGSAMAIDDSIQADAAEMHYCLLELQPGYRIALCCIAGDGIAPKLRVYGGGDGLTAELRGVSSGWGGSGDSR